MHTVDSRGRKTVRRGKLPGPASRALIRSENRVARAIITLRKVEPQARALEILEKRPELASHLTTHILDFKGQMMAYLKAEIEQGREDNRFILKNRREPEPEAA